MKSKMSITKWETPQHLYEKVVLKKGWFSVESKTYIINKNNNQEKYGK